MTCSFTHSAVILARRPVHVSSGCRRVQVTEKPKFWCSASRSRNSCWKRCRWSWREEVRGRRSEDGGQRTRSQAVECVPKYNLGTSKHNLGTSKRSTLTCDAFVRELRETSRNRQSSY